MGRCWGTTNVLEWEMRRIPQFLVVLLVCLAPLSARAEASKAVASGVRYTHIGDYNVERLNRILGEEVKEFSSFAVHYPPATNAVSLYRVVYETTIPERGNQPTTASGLVAVPQVPQHTLPVVSYQHGTVFTKTAVPSHPEESMETRLMVARFAGQGYLVIAADYVGKGESTEPDSYMVRDVTVQACLDMLLASRAVCADLGLRQSDLFLSGWSQGAWSTMQFRHKLESLNMPIKAAATASTPSDLYLLFTRWINNPSPLDASYLVGIPVLFLNSYGYYYGLPGLVQVAIRPEYQKSATEFYANTIGWEQAQKQLPAKVADLLQPAFAAESSMATSLFYSRLQDNQAYRWRYATPSRYYYGKIDEVLPPYVGTLPVGYTEAVGGAKAESVYAGDNADHRGTFLFGVLDQKPFFDGLH